MLTLALIVSVLAQPNLSPLDQSLGWQSLNSAQDWRGYKQTSFPAQGWTVKDGTILHAKAGGGGDLITTEQYGDFELQIDFRSAAKANSGIIWHVAEKYDATYQTGPEYQVLEDATYGAKPDDVHSTGAMYDLYAPAAGKKLNGVGEWNTARIYFRNGYVQHWLNGQKLVEAHIFDSDNKPTKKWLDTIAASKFKDSKDFGILAKGHIALQDHGDEVAYRNARIRALDTKSPKQIDLFNGKDLTGWKAIVPDAAKANMKPEDVWEVKDGVLICKGKPGGYIRTEKDYKNYVLRLQWRFNPVTKKAGNSGVLLRMVGEDKVWPKSIEAQLQSGSAGDFWNIEDVKMTVDKARTNGRNTKKTHGAEHPVGEWNEYEIIANNGDVILYVNGEELNRATNVEVVAGKICLQSEGAEIHFRDIRVIPLD